MLQLIRQGATTRAALVELTGLARSTVSQRIDQLLAHGLLVSAGANISTGGRPPTVLAFNPQFGVVLAGDVGATRCHAAVTDLDANVLAEATDEIAVADGPDVVLPWLAERFERLLAEAGRSGADVRGVGVGLPGPVEFATGQPVHPPIMPGWNGVRVGDRLSEQLGAPVLVDNDVNVMALGEHRLAWPTTENLLFVKVGTGIGCGIVAGGHIYRGADGSAGDLGHIRAPRAAGITCTCGNDGCLEAIAGGGALASRLCDAGIAARDVHDVAALLHQVDRTATGLARHAGRDIGDVLASIVNFFNPAVIVFGGEIADAAEDLLTGVREVVYQRSPPLATRHLTVVHSSAGARAGVVGASVMATEHILAPPAIDRRLLSAA
ncbi:MAG TPA: ROK family transcriptional regulator [Gaiellales bacterium]|jgi:predicted NBD/HSP70 family sugar kinase